MNIFAKQVWLQLPYGLRELLTIMLAAAVFSVIFMMVIWIGPWSATAEWVGSLSAIIVGGFAYTVASGNGTDKIIMVLASVAISFLVRLWIIEVIIPLVIS